MSLFSSSKSSISSVRERTKELNQNRVNPYKGLFFFDSAFRPVPLEQHFIGIKGANQGLINERMNMTCFERVVENVKQGYQVLVFVHSRKETVRIGQYLVKTLMDNAQSKDDDSKGSLFSCVEHPQFTLAESQLRSSRNKELKALFSQGVGCHHAGMVRSDRLFVEKWFAQGCIKVLCCTSTLAWGVNLPAHAVVIKGTQVYDSTKGTSTDLSVLDVLQIFGRAGRPQFDTEGTAYILTYHNRLQHYVNAMTEQAPIESRFIEKLPDYLNAEIALGTIANLEDGLEWFKDTYMFLRMQKNPLVYGLNHEDPIKDPTLYQKRMVMITKAIDDLCKINMVAFDRSGSGKVMPRPLGKIASDYYIRLESIETFMSLLKPSMTEADALSIMSLSTEFTQIQAREDEMDELEKLERGCVCQVKVTFFCTV